MIKAINVRDSFGDDDLIGCSNITIEQSEMQQVDDSMNDKESACYSYGRE